MKKILLVAMILTCTVCAGCFRAEFDMIITEDGAVVQHCKFVGNALVIRQIEEWKTKLEKLNPDVKAKPISEGDMLGYEFTFNYPDIETFAKAPNNLYAPHAGKNKGISQRKGWFFDEYDFDFYFESPPANLPPETEFMTQAAFNGVVFDMTIQLPYPAEIHNADTVSSGGKHLKWNLASVLLHGGERHMNTRFKLWHMDRLALTILVELLLLAATIFFFRKTRGEESESLRKDLRFKRNVFAGLSVALALVAAYLLLASVTFTNADIISLAI